jgi:ankyrin repeat protein
LFNISDKDQIVETILSYSTKSEEDLFGLDDDYFWYGKIRYVDEVIKADKMTPTAYDNISIERACTNGWVDVVEKLLEHKEVDLTMSNNYPIRIAFRKGYIKIAQLLLENLLTQKGKTVKELNSILKEDENSRHYKIDWKSKNGKVTIEKLKLDTKQINKDNLVLIEEWAKENQYLIEKNEKITIITKPKKEKKSFIKMFLQW